MTSVSVLGQMGDRVSGKTSWSSPPQGSRLRCKLKIVSPKTYYGGKEPLAAILVPLHCGVPDDLSAAGLNICFLHEMPQQSFSRAGIKGQFTAIASMSF